jgi:hypothetical protein
MRAICEDPHGRAKLVTMRLFCGITLVLCACGAADDPPAPPVGGTGAMITVSGTLGGGSYGSEGSSGSTTDTSGSTTRSDESSSSSSGGPACAQDGESCENGGKCIMLDSGFGCSHGQPGEPCVLPEDCLTLKCFEQPAELDAPGICTGLICDVPMSPCETNGTCVLANDGMSYCSHGQVGEPCTTDADCVGGMMQCQEYALEAGTVLLCK